MKIDPEGPINSIPGLVQMMARHQPGNKPLSELIIVSLLMQIDTSLGLNELSKKMKVWIDCRFRSKSKN